MLQAIFFFLNYYKIVEIVTLDYFDSLIIKLYLKDWRFINVVFLSNIILFKNHYQFVSYYSSLSFL
jgi:hypothetical protein